MIRTSADVSTREPTPHQGSVPGDFTAPVRRRSDSDALALGVVHLVANQAWRPRLRAAGVHFGLSAVAAAVVSACVLWLWYPGALASLHGVYTMMLILLGVDLVLGPVCTFMVFDRRKKSLPMDLAIIAAIQIVALAYGIHVIQQGRPQYVLLVKDRFEVVSPAELSRTAQAQAQANPAVRSPSLVPQWLAVNAPESVAQRNAILFESLSGGRDLQHHPELYVPLMRGAPAAAARGISVERIRQLNPTERARIDAAVAASGLPENDLRVLPLRGPARDGAVLVALPSGRVLEVLAIQPW